METVAKLDDLRADRGLRVDVGSEKLLLVRDGPSVRAFSALCPHAQGPLEEGAICNGRIVCPWHKATFQVSDGALLEPPALEGLARYPVRVEGDDIFVTPIAIKEPESKPPRDPRTFLIVGAGAAGATGAAALREFGFGGRIVLVGREPELPFDRTSLSKFVVAGQMSPGDTPLMLPTEFYRDKDIERIEADVTRLDAATHQASLADGRPLRFDSALIATGAIPKSLDIPGAGLAGVHALRSREDASAILADIRPGVGAVILGSSFIGLEVASSLRQQNVEVSVVSPDAVPFVKQFGKRIGRSFLSMHEAHGVTFYADVRAAKLEGEKHVEAVILEDGRRLPAGLVVVGVGVRPATDFLQNAKCNGDGSIPVDLAMRVAPGIYAAGDIAAFPAPAEGPPKRIEHWRVAQQQARVAAANMLGQNATYQGVPFFWTYHYGKNFEYLGHATSWDEEIIRGEPEKQNFVALLLNRKMVTAVVACGHERATALLAEKMRNPISQDDALRLID